MSKLGGTAVFHLENCPIGDENVAWQNKGGEGDKDSSFASPFPPYFEALYKCCPHLSKFSRMGKIGQKALK